MIRFAMPIAFVLLLLLPMVWMRLGRAGARMKLPMRSIEGEGGSEHTVKTVRWRLRGLLRVMRVVGMGLLVVALARPQRVSGVTHTKTEGVAIQIVVDRSGSMSEQMVVEGKPARKIDVVKRVVELFMLGDGKSLKGRAGDLVGMIAFARYADTICPLVRSPEALVKLAARVDVAKVQSEDGTAIGEAIALAAARLKNAQERMAEQGSDDLVLKSRVIVLLTDGVNNAGAIEPVQAADLASQWGIRIYTVGIGGSERTIQFGGQQIAVGGGLDIALLEGIAQKTGGRFFMAEDAEKLMEVYRQIDELETTSIQTTEYVNVQELFVPWAAWALGLMCFELVFGMTVLRRLP